MPNYDIKKVLVLGSGTLITGQAAEFDFSGAQACKIFHDRGISTVLVNSNSATLLADRTVTDALYIEPLDLDRVLKILETEKPDAIYAVAGGQQALNIAMDLDADGYLKQHNIRMLGPSMDSIFLAEGGSEFIQAMESMGIPVGNADVVKSVDEAVMFHNRHGFPVSLRPVYPVIGGTTRVASDMDTLREYARLCLMESRVKECYIEACDPAFKNLEYDVICDGNTCVAVCSMEDVFNIGYNMDDSIVVAPVMTLHPEHDRFMKSTARKLARALGILGVCSIRFAIKNDGSEYIIRRIIPRFSRSITFASKATGYHLPRVSIMVALGHKLEEIDISLDKGANAAMEPLSDSIAIRFPWNSLDETVSERVSGRQVSGETISIGISFEQALLKGIRSSGGKISSLAHPSSADMDAGSLRTAIEARNGQSMYHAAEALRRGFAADEVSDLAGADIWFIRRIRNVIELEKELEKMAFDRDLLIRAKDMGLPDSRIAQLWSADEERVREVRHEQGILPRYNILDTSAGRYDTESTYLYSIYSNLNDEDNSIPDAGKQSVVVIGPGPIKFTQGMEYEFSALQCIKAVKDMGYETVMINCNPETATTDYDTADRMYLEPMTPEDVVSVLDRETPLGVIIQFSGRAATKLADSITNAGYRILGTSLKDMDNAGDRKEIIAMVDRARLPRPESRVVLSLDQALIEAEDLGYPVLFGINEDMDNMEVAHTSRDITEYINRTAELPEYYGQPYIISENIQGNEIEVDAVYDGEQILVAGIMEHIERIGIHANDSICVFPMQKTGGTVMKKVEEYTATLAQMLNIKGLINAKYIIFEEELYVKEINPASSQTIPYISGVTGIPVIEEAVRVCLGEKLDADKYRPLTDAGANQVAIKAPVFNCIRKDNSDDYDTLPYGDVLAVKDEYPFALIKGITASGMRLPRQNGGKALLTVNDGDKSRVLQIAERLVGMDYRIYATKGTAHYLNRNYLGCDMIRRLDEETPNIRQLMEDDLDFIIYTPNAQEIGNSHEYDIKKLAIANGIMCITSMDTADIIVNTIKGHGGSFIAPEPVNKG